MHHVNPYVVLRYRYTNTAKLIWGGAVVVGL